MLGSKVRFAVCFAVTFDSGLTYFRRRKMSTTSSVGLLLAFMFLNVCSVSFQMGEKKSYLSSLLIFHVAF